MNFMRTDDSEHDTPSMYHTWAEYDDYLDHSGYASNVMYQQSESDYDSTDDDVDRGGRRLLDENVTEEVVQDSPQSPPVTKQGPDGLPAQDRAGPSDSHIDFVDYYATPAFQNVEPHGSPDRQNPAHGDWMTYP